MHFSLEIQVGASSSCCSLHVNEELLQEEGGVAHALASGQDRQSQL